MIIDNESEYTPNVNKEDDSIIIEGTPKETKDKFFAILESEVQIVDNDQFREMFPDTYIGAFSRTTISKENNWKKRIEGVKVYLNKDDFIINGEDYSDLMPIIIRHEIAELWYLSKTGFSLSPPPKVIGKERQEAFSHALALREEYRYAFEIGKAERLLEFIKKHHEFVAPSETVLEENQRAYELIKQREKKLG